jgi:hypothetical protein
MVNATESIFSVPDTTCFAMDTIFSVPQKTVGEAPAVFEPLNQTLKGNMIMFQHVRIAVGFRSQSAGQLAATAGGNITGLTGNPAFPSPPVELKIVQGAVDELNAALAAQAHGGPAATAEKQAEIPDHAPVQAQALC